MYSEIKIAEYSKLNIEVNGTYLYSKVKYRFVFHIKYWYV
jgi:hypothetical protein